MKITFYTTAILFSLITTFIRAQDKETIPLDKDVVHGKLANGLTYYILKNKKPENRLELRLAVKAGSVNEDKDQLGLAHFCEHMAFNGTLNFPEQELINYLESVGIDFGADLNAYTGFDETVYMLKVPTDKQELVDKGFQVLEDWAHNVTYDSVEIDKERGVIFEEWRLGKGAEDRIWRKQLPVMMYKSRYAERDVIGDTGVFLNVPCENFRRFYREWYRPDLMAVIAVGDFDVNMITEKIKAHFGKLKMPQNPRKREEYPLPDNPGVLVSVESDKELAFPSVSVYFKYPERKNATYESHRLSALENIISSMLGDRLTELTRKQNPPFEYAWAYASDFFGDKRAFTISASIRGNEVTAAYETVLTEAYRAAQAGFTVQELERAKSDALKRAERAWNEREKTESRSIVWRLTSVFLKGNSYAGFDKEFELAQKEVPSITIDEINNYMKKLIRAENVIVLVSSPEKEGFVKPPAGKISAFFSEISAKKLEIYKDDALNIALFTKNVTPGKVKEKKEIAEIGVTELILANGAKIILKPTEFKNDEIRFSAFSYGGLSQTGDNDYYLVNEAAGIIEESGIGGFSQTQLEKHLSGKIVSLWPYIGEYSEGFSGSSSAKDIVTLLQMINLYFTEPRSDKEAFEAFKAKRVSEYTNRRNMPEWAFYDSIGAVSYSYHFRRLPMTEMLAEKMNLEKSVQFFKERYSGADDFTFLFCGSFKNEEIIPVIEKYIGSIPPAGKKEVKNDTGIRFSDKPEVKKIYNGIDPKSMVEIKIGGEFDFNNENRYMMKALLEVFNIRLREVIREDKGGTYGIYSRSYEDNFPEKNYVITIGWGCKPERVDELVDAVKGVIAEMKGGLDSTYINKVKEILRRKYEVNIKENNWWLRQLYTCYYYNESPLAVLQAEKFTGKITTDEIKKLSNKYLNEKMLIFELFPENLKE